MELARLIPTAGSMDLEKFAAGPLKRLGQARFRPFDPGVKAFWAAVGRQLLADPRARRHPELVSLGFFLRAAELERLERAFELTRPAACVTAPLGLVFHLPPANVDTIFVYSWALSALAGNANIIRLSSRRSPAGELLLSFIRDLVKKLGPGLAGSLEVVAYGHETQVTRILSQAADLRVTWGGDATIQAVREAGLAPGAREMVFPDRFSLAALNAQAWLDATPGERAQVAEGFVNDAFWFGQLACSSPRLVAWVGEEGLAQAASADFFIRVDQAATAKGFKWEAGVSLAKLTLANRAVLDMDVAAYRRYGASVDVLRLKSLEGFDRRHEGGGFFYEIEVDSLLSLAPFFTPRDQTLTYFGFEESCMRELATALKGRGPCRMLPIGRALNFSRFWDGMDLLSQMSRLIHVEGPA